MARNAPPLTCIMSFVLLFMIVSCSKAESPDMTSNFSKLERYLTLLNENSKMMTAVVVTKNGEPLFEYYAGMASIEQQAPISQLTRFRIGSITKIFTAVLIMQLIEADRLSLDTKLEAFFPQIPNADRITVESLLSHRTGIYNFTNAPVYMTYMTEAQSSDTHIRRIQAYEPEFEPGSQHEYSNSNYLLLGFIIERLYDKPFADVVNDRISQPLGLTSTYFGKPIKVEENEARSYQFEGKWTVQPETHMSVPHAAGAMVSTAKETNTFLAALFQGKLISESSLNAMMSLRDGYGLGLMGFPFYKRSFFGHNGGIDGFVSNVSHNPKDGVTLTVLSNGVNYDFNEVLIAILSSVYGLEFDIPDFAAKPVALSSDAMAMLVGQFSSEDLPLEITVRIDESGLVAQATGQAPFPLSPYSDTELRFDPASIVIQFDPDSEVNGQLTRFTLNQGGGSYRYVKQ